MITEKDYEAFKTTAVIALGSIAEALVPVMQIFVKMQDEGIITPAPIPAPLTREQIEKMDGELVVVPESENSAGGIGRVNLGKNIVEGCAPTDQYAWPLDRYGEMFIAYSVSTDKSAPLYWR